MIQHKNIFSFLCLLLSFLLYASPAKAARLRYGTIPLHNSTRDYYFYVPSKLEGKTDYPLLFILHGAMGNGKKAAENWGFMEVAEKEGFVAVFPNGLHEQWNDGRNAPFSNVDTSHTDDVGFLSGLIQTFITKYGADPDRIYMTGASNGGMMTLRMGCEASSQLTAIAPLLASIPENIYKNCLPDKALPVFMMNGSADKIVPPQGGDVMLGDRSYGKVSSIDSTINLWVMRNGCDAAPTVAPMEEYEPTRDAEGITAEYYTNCATGKAIILYLIDKGGHQIPSFKHRRSFFNFDGDEAFNAAAEIWDFFKRYKK